MMTNVVARASHIAAGQWGLLTTAQAVHEGISRLQPARLADAGVLQRVGRGVYATTSTLANTSAPGSVARAAALGVELTFQLAVVQVGALVTVEPPHDVLEALPRGRETIRSRRPRG